MEKRGLKKILVVDDDPAMQEMVILTLSCMLNQNSYEFDTANNGENALDKVKNDADVAMILVDMNMPVMDGMAFLAELKELNKPLIKTVVVSGYHDTKRIRNALDLGAFDFVVKPIDFDKLVNIIEKGLN